jgi:hypothetical protein
MVRHLIVRFAGKAVFLRLVVGVDGADDEHVALSGQLELGDELGRAGVDVCDGYVVLCFIGGLDGLHGVFQARAGVDEQLDRLGRRFGLSRRHGFRR